MLRPRALERIITSWAEGLAHPSAANDNRILRRHAEFIAGRMLTGMAAVAALPAVALMRGGLGALEWTLFAGLIAPMAAALFVARTGRLELSRLLSAGALVTVIAVASWLSGGLLSPALAWLVVAPFDSVEHPTSRDVAIVGIVATLAALAVAALGLHQATPALTPSSVVTATVFVLGALAATTVKVLRARRPAAAGGREMRALEEHSEGLLEHLGDLFTRHDQDANCTYASAAVQSMLGVSRPGLLGQGLFQRVHVGDRPAYLKAISDAAGRRQTASAVIRLRKDESGPHDEADSHRQADPSFIVAELRAYPMPEATVRDGRVEVIAHLRDATEEAMRREEVERERLAAEQASAGKAQFLATVSHELRTPLSAVIGFAQILASPELCPKDPERLRDYARTIHESGSHLLDVVNAFLDASRIESGHFDLSVDRFDLAAVVASCCGMVALKASDTGVRLSTDIPREGLQFAGDQRACRQIVLNLVSNAVKFTPKDGRVSVALRRVGSFVELAVDDTGIGIAACDLARLGDPFFQAKSSYDRAYEGTGLGLSVVRGLVGLHGGLMQVESTPGSGTSVRVKMPAERPASGLCGPTVARIDARPRRTTIQAVA